MAIKAFFELLRLDSCENVKDLHPNIINFIMWLIQHFTQLSSSAAKTDKTGVFIVEHKKWSDITSKHHSFVRSNQLLEKWTQCLQSIGISDVNVGLRGLHGKACMVHCYTVFYVI